MKTIDLDKYPNLKNNGFQVVDLSDKLTLDKVIDGVVSAYKNVFNNSAWGEGVKCSFGCGYKTTFEKAPENCPSCGGEIEDFYSNKEVELALKYVVNKKKYKQVLILLGGDEQIVGFTWGWTTDLKKLNEEKLELSKDKYKKLCSSLKEVGTNPDKDFYYQSETGTISNYRRKGLGKALIYLNQDILEKNKKEVLQIIQRTSKGSPMYKIREDQGYKKVFDYEDEDDRVIFAKFNN